jgi:hypothetical protein
MKKAKKNNELVRAPIIMDEEDALLSLKRDNEKLRKALTHVLVFCSNELHICGLIRNHADVADIHAAVAKALGGGK